MINRSVDRYPINPVELTQALIRIPSEGRTPKDPALHTPERPLVEYMKEWVTVRASNGFKAQEIATADSERPSLLVSNSDLPRLIVVSHIDTVPRWEVGSKEGQGQYDPFGATIVDGMVYGRGAGDAKSAVAAMLVAAALSENAIPTALALTSDEETRFGGIDAMGAHFGKLMAANPGYEPVFVFSTNGNGEEISYGCRGLWEIDTVVRGKTGHAAIRKPGVPAPINAFDATIDAYVGLRQFYAGQEPTFLGNVTINPGGGRYGLRVNNEIVTRYNSVADTSEIALEGRPNGGFHNGTALDASHAEGLIRRFVEASGATIESSKIVAERPAWRSNRTEGLWLEDIIKRTTGVSEVPEWVYGEHGYDEVAILIGELSKKRQGSIAGGLWGIGISTKFHAVDEGVYVDKIGQLESVVRQAMTSPDLRSRTYSLPS